MYSEICFCILCFFVVGCACLFFLEEVGELGGGGGGYGKVLLVIVIL